MVGGLHRPDALMRKRMAQIYIKTRDPKSKIAQDHGFSSPRVVDTSLKHALEAGHVTEKQVRKADLRRAKKEAGRTLIVTKPLVLLPKKLLPKPVHDYLYTNKPVTQIAKESGLKNAKAVMDWANTLGKKGVLRAETIDAAGKKKRKSTPVSAEASASFKFMKAEWSGSVKLQRGEQKKPSETKQKKELKPPEPRINLHPAVYDLLYTKEPVPKLLVKHGMNSYIELLRFARNQALKQMEKKKTKK